MYDRFWYEVPKDGGCHGALASRVQCCLVNYHRKPATINGVRKAVLVVSCVLLFCGASPVEALEDAKKCVKASFKGDASTYNPNFPGYRTGGQGLATGGKYNPSEFEAALQLDLAKQYKCGYGAGAVCAAIVSAPSGRAMVVKINDNGPLVPGRIIDLNEKSMRYLSADFNGQNRGLVKDVTVTLLCSLEGQYFGPLDEKSREEWLKRVFDAPYANRDGALARPYTVGFPAGGPSPYSGSLQSSDDYCITSIQPVVVQPRGSVPDSQCYNPRASQQQLPPPPQQQMQMSPTQSPSVQAAPNKNASQQLNQAFGEESNPDTVSQAPVAALIIAQSPRIPRGGKTLISWVSVGMTPDSCSVSLNDAPFASGNRGSKVLAPSATQNNGTLSFTLSCTSSAGESIEKEVKVVVQ